MPKTDERGTPCHDKRDNYCPVCGWDCEDKPAMTDPTISQDAREAAADAGTNLGWSGTLVNDTRWGICDKMPEEYPQQASLVQAFARFEAHLRSPASSVSFLGGMSDEDYADFRTAAVRSNPGIAASEEAGEQPPPYTCKHGCERDEIIERLSATDTEAMRLLLREAVMRGIKQPSARDYVTGDDFRDALRDYDAFIARIDALAKGGA